MHLRYRQHHLNRYQLFLMSHSGMHLHYRQHHLHQYQQFPLHHLGMHLRYRPYHLHQYQRFLLHHWECIGVITNGILSINVSGSFGKHPRYRQRIIISLMFLVIGNASALSPYTCHYPNLTFRVGVIRECIRIITNTILIGIN